jgi:hypothetical protein
MVHTYQSGYWVNIHIVDFTNIRLLGFFLETIYNLTFDIKQVLVSFRSVGLSLVV